MTTTGTSLYRLFDINGRLLYIGIAGNPGRRFEQHAKEKPWWSEVARIALTHYESRAVALEVERNAIISEQPLHNLVHNKMRPVSKKSRQQIHARDRIAFHCRGCTTEIADNEGYLQVSLKAVHQIAQARKTWESKYTNEFGMLVLQGSAFREMPESVKWTAWHRRCDPDINGSAYWFGVERIRSYEDVLDWTAHLMEKDWLEFTNWGDLIRSLIVGPKTTKVA